MVFTGLHNSRSSIITVSSMPLKKKRMYRSGQSLEDFSRVVATNGAPIRSAISPTRNKHPVPKAGKQEKLLEKDVDFEMQFGKGGSLDDNDCMWLSLDCLSPSFSDKCRFSGSRLFVDGWLSSWLSNVSWGEPDKCSIPDLHVPLSGDSKDEEAATWLLTPFQNDGLDFSLSLSEDAMRSDNSSTQFSRNSDLQTQDLQRANFTHSLGGIDEKGNEWISNMKSYQLENFLRSSSSSSDLVPTVVVQHLDFSSEDASGTGTADLNNDESEPIFWPFEGKFDVNTEETMRYLSMSPRKDLRVRESAKSTMTWKYRRGGRPRRQLQFAAEPKSFKGSESSLSSGKTLGKVNATVPSRLSRNSSDNKGAVPLASEASTVPPRESPDSGSDLYGEEDFTYKFDHELPIEKLMGLSEFDGHEGIDADFDGDVFSLDESLQQFLAP